MSGRSLTHATRCGEFVLKHAARGPGRQQRTFASSASCQIIPTFGKTSSTELDELLSAYRLNLFMPAQLSTHRRKLVYGKQTEKMMNAGPVSVQLDGEKFELQALDRLVDEPGKLKGLVRVLQLSKKGGDFQQLWPLLVGYKEIKWKLDYVQYIKMIRCAGKAGHLGPLIRCMRGAKTTGFSLGHPEILKEVVFWIHRYAAERKWKSQATEKSLEWAQAVAEMLEKPEHAPSDPTINALELRAMPQLLGLLLELYAVRASRAHINQDVDGKVARYTQILVGSDIELRGREVTPDKRLFEDESGKTFNRAESIEKPQKWLLAAAPIVHGMRLASELLPDSASLQAKLRELEEKATSVVQALQEVLPENEKEPAGLRVYKELLLEDPAPHA